MMYQGMNKNENMYNQTEVAIYALNVLKQDFSNENDPNYKEIQPLLIINLKKIVDLINE